MMKDGRGVVTRDRMLPNSGQDGHNVQDMAPSIIGTSPLHCTPSRVSTLAHPHQVARSCQGADQVRRDPDRVPLVSGKNLALTYCIRTLTSCHIFRVAEP